MHALVLVVAFALPVLVLRPGQAGVSLVRLLIGEPCVLTSDVPSHHAHQNRLCFGLVISEISREELIRHVMLERNNGLHIIAVDNLIFLFLEMRPIVAHHFFFALLQVA